MSDILTPAQRSYNMSRIRSRDTTPERAVRHVLWHKGYRRLPGSPDLVLPKYRAVIFINSCFWHGHRGCSKYVEPKTNAGFWREKIARNIDRDELGAQCLNTLAWTVITVWECELTKKNLDATITVITSSEAHSAPPNSTCGCSTARLFAPAPYVSPPALRQYSTATVVVGD